MKQLKSSLSNLKQIFTRTIAIREITEPLASFDHDQSSANVAAFMDKRGFDVVGIRQHGAIIGYANRKDLAGAIVGTYVRFFEPGQILSDGEPLLEAFKALNDRPRIYIYIIGHIGGIVTRGDLQKTPVRMWLFGLVSLTEMQMLRVIRDRLSTEQWTRLLPNQRRKYAEEVFKQRRTQNVEIDLSDCLHFADKIKIFVNNDELFELLKMDSKNDAKSFFDKVQKLRDALAHSNDILGGKWPELVDVVTKLENVLGRLENHKA